MKNSLVGPLVLFEMNTHVSIYIDTCDMCVHQPVILKDSWLIPNLLSSDMKFNYFWENNVLI